MIVKIEIPDNQAAVLSAKAVAEGLTLESWLQKLAEQEASPASERAPGAQHASVVVDRRRLRASIKRDPDGWTTRDYVNYGRP